MKYTDQKWFCQACGREMNAPLTGRWHNRTCSGRCFYEFEWRRTLSIMGKEYYPDPREYDADGHPSK
jgi:hypothetical protein